MEWLTATLLLSVAVMTSCLSRDYCSQSERPVTVTPGAQAYISVLVDMHNHESGSYGCGNLRLENMQAFEAMRWALQRINQDSGVIDGTYITDSYIPGIKIGMLAEDTCSSSKVAARAVMASFPEVISTSRMCNESDTLLLGVIGGSSSNATAPTVELLREFGIPYISYTARSSMLTDTTASYFMRTTPPEHLQVQVILEALKKLKWEKVALVYTDDFHGMDGYQRLRNTAQQTGICIGVALQVAAEETSLTAFQDVLKQLLATNTTGVIVFGTKAVASGLIQAGLTVRGAGRLQFLHSDALGPDTDTVANWNYARGIMTVSPSYRIISEFENYWTRLNFTNPIPGNPWLQEWYMAKNRCRLPGVSYPPYDTYIDCQSVGSNLDSDYMQNPDVEPAVMAVYAYAKALKNAHGNLCGSSYRGACKNLKQLSTSDFYQSYLQNIDLTFSRDERIPTLSALFISGGPKKLKLDENGELANPSYDVWSYNNVDGSYKFQKIATYAEGQLDYVGGRLLMYDESRQRSITPAPTSLCADTCSLCLTSQQRASKYAYIDGDILIGGVFSVHKQGDNAFSCGTVSPENAQLVQAFLYAVNRITTLGTLRGGVRLGGVIFDDCSSQISAENAVSNYLTGMVTLQHAGGQIDASKTFAVAGSSTDEVSLALAKLSTDLKFSLTGYKAQSYVLSDSSKFPYYSTLVSDDGYVIDALLALVKRIGWSFVQLVHSDSELHQKFADKLRLQASKSDVCFSNSGTFSSKANLTALANNLTSNLFAKVIVVHLEQQNAKSLLSALNQSSTVTQYAVLATRNWMTSSMESFVKGLRFPILTIQPKSSNFQIFYNYLRSLTPTVEGTNPWFDEWYESELNCYINPNQPKGLPRQCVDIQNTPITTATEIKLNPYSIHVANSVLAIARGLDATLRQFCGSSYTSVCSAFRLNPNVADVISGNIRNASFVDDTGTINKLLDGVSTTGFDYMFTYQALTVKAGDYLPEMSQLNIDLSRLNAMRYVTSRCAPTLGNNGVTCPECGYMYQLQQVLSTPGDITLAGIFNVHNKGSSTYSCGGIRQQDGYLYTEAFMYAINQINKGEAPVTLKGIRLGGLVMDACSSPLRASNLVSSVYSGAFQLPFKSPVVGWTASGDELSFEMYNLLNRTATTFISATSSIYSMDDLMTHFYRSVATDDSHTEALLQLVRYLGWEYIQAVYSNDTRGHNQFALFKAKAMNEGVCILSSYEIGPNSPMDIVKGMLTSTTPVAVIFADEDLTSKLVSAKESLGNVAQSIILLTTNIIGLVSYPSTAHRSLSIVPHTTSLQDFDAYMTSKRVTDETNPWFKQYYEAVLECDLGPSGSYRQPCIANNPVTDGNRYKQDAGVVTTISAVYAMAQALNMTIQDLCGSSSTGLCDNARSSDLLTRGLYEKLNNVTFLESSGKNFTFTNQAHERSYDVRLFKNGKYEKVGVFDKGTLQISDSSLGSLYTDISATCPDGCLLCRYSIDTQEQFTYVPGDILLSGIFDVHKHGNNPFSCGDINMNQGFQLLEAYNYAIEYINSKRGIFAGRLNGVKIGGIGLDSCMSPHKAGNLVANLHSGILELKDSAGIRVPTEIIDAYIGGYGSDVSQRISEVLTVLAIPQISYGSTSMSFGDTNTYPYFIRTVPNDDLRAKTMIALLQRQHVEYIQVVISDTYNTKESAQVFMDQAAQKGLCIAQNVTIKDVRTLTRSAVRDAVLTLLRKERAKVVVLFLETDALTLFMEEAEKVVGTVGTENLRFFGSETWADRREVVSSLRTSAQDSMTVGVEKAATTDFQQYLERKLPSSYTSNPWFKEYYENVYQCSLIPGTGNFPSQCDLTTRGVTQAPAYVTDPYILHTINAVYAAALGIDRALRRLCGDSYSGVCESYRRSGDRRQRIMDGIKQASFADMSDQQEFKFQQNGESNKGYQIYSIQQNQQGQSFYYVTVGSYNDRQLLRLASSLNVNWNSQCTQTSDCTECSSFGKMQTQYMSSTADLNIVGFFNVHKQDTMDSLRCGAVDTRSGFQSALAFFYTIDQINDKRLVGLQLPADVKLGGVAVDTCSNHLRVTQDTFSLLLGQGLAGGRVVDPSSVAAYLAMGHSNAKAAAEILSPRKMTTVHLGPSSSLMSKTYYTSMTSSIDQETLAMSYLLSYFNLAYVSVVYSSDEEGKLSYDMFVKKINDVPIISSSSSLCIAKAFEFVNTLNIVNELDKVAGARVVVLFTNAKDTVSLFQAVKSSGKQQHFEWVISNRIDIASDIPENLMEIVRGAIIFTANTNPTSAVMQDFKQYVTSLTVANHKNIPDDWFDEFWQNMLRCRLDNSTVPQQSFPRPCRDDDRLTPQMISMNEVPGVYQTILSTYIITQATTSIDECRASLRTCLATHKEKGDLIYNALRDSRLINNFQFHFLKDGSGSLGFDIINLQYDRTMDSYTYVKIGNWNATTQSISLNNSVLRAYDEYGIVESSYPVSRCPTMTCSCLNRITINGTTSNTVYNEIVTVDRNEYFHQAWGIILSALTAAGIVCSISSFMYLLIYYPFKGGTTVLGYTLLFGVVCMYVLVFAYIVHADVHVCGIRRFCVGFVYSICFSCMIVKVLNNWRLGAYVAEYVPPSKERIAHPFSLFFIALFLILVQVIIGIMWLVLKPPEVYMSGGIPRCVDSFSGDSDKELVLSLVYVMMLICVTCIFSGVTCCSEENNRESCWILAATVFTIAIWIAWTVITTIANRAYREVTLAAALLANATVLLLCIFVRKIYLLVRYRKDEEERRSQYAASSTQDAPSKVNEVYGTLYPNQMYNGIDNVGFSASNEKLNHPGSGVVYIYDGHHPSHDVEF